MSAAEDYRMTRSKRAERKPTREPPQERKPRQYKTKCIWCGKELPFPGNEPACSRCFEQMNKPITATGI